MESPANTATTNKPLRYLVVHCATPGCFTAIRVRVETYTHELTCKWCEAGESHATLGKPSVDIRFQRLLAIT